MALLCDLPKLITNHSIKGCPVPKTIIGYTNITLDRHPGLSTTKTLIGEVYDVKPVL